VLII